MKITPTILLLALFTNIAHAQLTGWQAVTNFGTNLGALNMYSYAPPALPTNAPLVIVMHGCSQTAADIATQSGWNTLAARHGFYTVYPEQIAANNSNLCFNWFEPNDQTKNQGEASSIQQMITYMRNNYSIDSTRIFVTGLSAGACMSNVLMACYPQLINSGAIMAGVGYKAASSAITASSALSGYVSNTPTQWGNYVRNQNPTYTGVYPKVAIFQGTGDLIVNYTNATEQVKQWTNVHGTNQIADATITNFANNAYVTQKTYNDTNNTPVVETYIINTFTHAIALDTGTCFMQCGITGTYAHDINFNSTYWAAYFFNILNYGNTITGLTSVTANQTNVTYSVTPHFLSSYYWETSPTATIPNGQNNNNSVTVNFGTQSGYIQLLEIDAYGCMIGPLKLWVNVGAVTAEPTTKDQQEYLYYNAEKQSLYLVNTSNEQKYVFSLFSLDGKLVSEQYTNCNEIYLPNILTAGIYIAQLQLSNRLITKKISIIK